MSTFSELIDFTRSSTGTYLDSVVYGDEASTGNWATAPSYNNVTTGTGTSVVSVLTGAGQNRCYLPIDNVEQGKSYITTITVDPASTTSFGYYVRDGSNPNSGDLLISQTVVSGETYTLFCTAVSDDMNVLLVGTSNSTMSATISVKEVTSTAGGTPLLRTADTNEPRLEYDASGQPLGLLIEEQRTNKVLRSAEFSNSWGGTNRTITENTVTAPDGTLTADEFKPTGTGIHIVSQDVSASAGFHTASCFFKKGTGKYGGIRLVNDAFANDRYSVLIDLETGLFVSDYEAGNPPSTAYKIDDYGNGWYRLSLTIEHFTSTMNITFFTNDDATPAWASTGLPEYTANETDYIYIWGAQLEQGSFPTSYIPTSGSTVTRNADIPSLPIERFSYNDTQGTLFGEFEHNAVNSSASFLVSDNTLNNRIQLTSRQTGTSGATAFISASGTTQTAFSASYNFIAGNKSTLAYKLNDCATTMNGYSVNADTSVTIPTVTTVYIGNINSGAKINGHVKRIQYFPKRLSNDELVELTKPSSSPTMSLTFDGQATSELVEGLHD